MSSSTTTTAWDGPTKHLVGVQNGYRFETPGEPLAGIQSIGGAFTRLDA